MKIGNLSDSRFYCKYFPVFQLQLLISHAGRITLIVTIKLYPRRLSLISFLYGVVSYCLELRGYKELLDFLVNTYLPAVRETVGLSALLADAKTYHYLIRYHTTTNMTAAAIERLSYKGFGQDQPIADNLSIEGRLKNRRFELKVRYD